MRLNHLDTQGREIGVGFRLLDRQHLSIRSQPGMIGLGLRGHEPLTIADVASKPISQSWIARWDMIEAVGITPLFIVEGVRDERGSVVDCQSISLNLTS